MLGRVMAVAALMALGVQAQDAEKKTFTSPGGTQLRVLVDAAALGGTEVELAELTFKPNSDSGEHQHGATETFYVLEGQLTQVVNGKPIALTRGMAASIRPTDHVVHRSGPEGAKVLVIWAPGGELARVISRWRTQ